MGVDEIVVIGTGILIYGVPHNNWEEDEFNPYDHFFQDAYSKDAPLFFTYKQKMLTDVFVSQQKLPNPKGEGWSVTDINKKEKEYDLEEVLDKIIHLIKSIKYDGDDKEGLMKFEEQQENFIKDFKKLVETKEFYIGKFLYRYFA